MGALDHGGLPHAGNRRDLSGSRPGRLRPPLSLAELATVRHQERGHRHHHGERVLETAHRCLCCRSFCGCWCSKSFGQCSKHAAWIDEVEVPTLGGLLLFAPPTEMQKPTTIHLALLVVVVRGMCSCCCFYGHDFFFSLVGSPINRTLPPACGLSLNPSVVYTVPLSYFSCALFGLPCPPNGRLWLPHRYTIFVSPTPMHVQTFAGFAWTFANALDVGFVHRSKGDLLAECSLEVRTRLSRGSQRIVLGGRGGFMSP